MRNSQTQPEHGFCHFLLLLKISYGLQNREVFQELLQKAVAIGQDEPGFLATEAQRAQSNCQILQHFAPGRKMPKAKTGTEGPFLKNLIKFAGFGRIR
jgi:hypothetical protein